MLRIGDRVKVMYPSGDVIGLEPIKCFQNKVTVVKGCHIYQKGKSSLGRSYTLAGCKSDYGIDYEFIEEWLIPLGESEEDV